MIATMTVHGDVLEASAPTGFALANLQDRSAFFIGPGVEVYEGMIVGENPRAEDMRVYGQGDAAVTVHVAYYRQQSFGRKLVNSQNMLVTSEDKVWRQTARGGSRVTVDGKPVPLRSTELRSGSLTGVSGGQTLHVRQVYWVNGRLTTSDHIAALLGVLGQLSGRGDDGAAITFYIAGADPDASAALETFVTAQLGPLTAWLETVRAAR
jgi:EpsI family protein